MPDNTVSEGSACAARLGLVAAALLAAGCPPPAVSSGLVAGIAASSLLSTFGGRSPLPLVSEAIARVERDHVEPVDTSALTTNLEELVALSNRCAGLRARVKRYRTSVKRVGDRLKGAHRHVERVRGISITLSVGVRFTGAAGDGFPVGTPSSRACVQTIARCLTE